ncbi:MAG: AAA family ATPase [Pirellulaceae bacterium]|nr:AAA family ATPase [Planctomycetales bacterium]
MILGIQHLQTLIRLLKSYPVVGVLGPRQIGKTTLAFHLAKQIQGDTNHFDLEDPRDLARLSDTAMTLEPLRGLVILDEIQR